jgi:hypothetical protein
MLRNINLDPFPPLADVVPFQTDCADFTGFSEVRPSAGDTGKSVDFPVALFSRMIAEGAFDGKIGLDKFMGLFFKEGGIYAICSPPTGSRVVPCRRRCVPHLPGLVEPLIYQLADDFSGEMKAHEPISPGPFNFHDNLVTGLQIVAAVKGIEQFIVLLFRLD